MASKKTTTKSKNTKNKSTTTTTSTASTIPTYTAADIEASSLAYYAKQTGGGVSVYDGDTLVSNPTLQPITINTQLNIVGSGSSSKNYTSTKGNNIKLRLKTANAYLLNDVTDSTSETWDAGRFLNQDEIMQRFHMGNEWGSQSNNDVFASGYEDPTRLTFKVEFGEWGASLLDLDTIAQQLTTSKFSNVYNEDYDAFPMGLLDLNFFKFDGSENWNDLTVYNTYNYLMNNNEDARAAYIQLFIKGLYTIQKDMPYLFQKISGLDSLLRFDATKGARLKDAKITLECIEGLDLKIRTLLRLYRKAAYDDVWQRWVLPDIYRYFRMIIYVFDRRNLHTGYGTYSMDLDNFPIMAFECSPCEFDIASTFEADYSTSWNDLKESNTNIVIKVKNVKTYYANKLFNKVDGLAAAVNWISDFDSITERSSFTSSDMSNLGNFRMRWMEHMFMMPSEWKAYHANITHKIGDESDKSDTYYYRGPNLPTDTWHMATVTDNLYLIKSWSGLLKSLKKAIFSHTVMVRDSRYSTNRTFFSNDLTRPYENTYHYNYQPMMWGPDIAEAYRHMRERIEIMLQHMLNSTYQIGTETFYNIVDIAPLDSSVEYEIKDIRPNEPVQPEHIPYVEPVFNLDKQTEVLIPNFADASIAPMEMVEPIFNTSLPDLNMIEPTMNLDKADLNYIEPIMNLDKVDMNMIEPIIDTHKLSQTFVDPIIDIHKNKQTLVEPIIDTTKPTLTYVEPIIDTTKANMELVELLQDLHKPTLTYVEPIMNTSIAPMEMVEPIMDEHKPEMEMVEPIMDEHKPEQVMVEPIMNVSVPEMEMVEPIQETSVPDMTFVEPILETSIPDMVMTEPILNLDHNSAPMVEPIIDTDKPNMTMVSYPEIDNSNHIKPLIRPLDTSTTPSLNLLSAYGDTDHEKHNFLENEANLDHLDLNMTGLTLNLDHIKHNFQGLEIDDIPENQKPMTTLEPIVENTSNMVMTALPNNDFKPEMDMTALPGNDFKPEMDMTALEQNTFIPDLKMTHVKDTSYNPDIKYTELELNTFIPEQVMLSLPLNVSLPEQVMLSLPLNVSLPEMIMTTPNDDSSKIEMIMTELNQNSSIPLIPMQELEIKDYENNMVLTLLDIKEETKKKPVFTEIDENLSKVHSPMTLPIKNDVSISMSYVKPEIRDYDQDMSYVRPLDPSKPDIKNSAFTLPIITDKTEIPTSALFDAIVEDNPHIKMLMVNITDSPKLVHKLEALTKIDVKELKTINTEQLVSLANIIEETYNEIRERERNMLMQDNYPPKEKKKKKVKMQSIPQPARNTFVGKNFVEVDQAAKDRAWDAKQYAESDKTNGTRGTAI